MVLRSTDLLPLSVGVGYVLGYMLCCDLKGMGDLWGSEDN